MTPFTRGRWRSLAALLVFAGYLFLGPAAAPTRAAPEPWCPTAATPYCAENAFLDFWRQVDAQTGGYALDILGYPISPPRLRPSDGRIVQFYERAIFEWHPENAREHQVQLSRLGALAIDTDTRLGLKQQQAKPPAPCDNATTCTTFDLTRHTLRGLFRRHWVANGGLSVYGYPLTEEFQLRYSNGVNYTVQYFERNRFEAHPESTDDRYKVLLGRLGAEELQRNLSAVNSWRVVSTPVYSGTGATPAPSGVAVTVQPESGPRGTTFVITVVGLPAGAALVRTVTYPSGQSASESVQLGPGVTSIQDTATTSATSQIGRREVAYSIDGRVVARAAYTVTATPATPPTSSAADDALVQAGIELIQAVPDMRYIADTLIARGVTWSFKPLDNAWGSYSPGRQAIVYSTALRGMDPHDIGSVTGHEGQHAYDIFEYGAPATTADCYRLEYRGFLASALLWHAWYGPGGVTNPVNDLERENNEILSDILYNNGDRLKRFIIDAYASECGAWLSGGGGGAAGAGTIPATTDGLPASLITTLPGAAAQLAWFAGDQLTAAALPGPAPTWRLR